MIPSVLGQLEGSRVTHTIFFDLRVNLFFFSHKSFYFDNIECFLYTFFFFNMLSKQPTVFSTEGDNMDMLNIVMDACNCNAFKTEAGGLQEV